MDFKKDKFTLLAEKLGVNIEGIPEELEQEEAGEVIMYGTDE